MAENTADALFRGANLDHVKPTTMAEPAEPAYPVSMRALCVYTRPAAEGKGHEFVFGVEEIESPKVHRNVEPFAAGVYPAVVFPY